MRKYGACIFLLTVVALAITLACGSSPTPRMLQTVNLSPPTASAQGNPVQFSATGNFNQPPSPQQLSQPTWGACYQHQRTSDVAVSASGLAQCAPGAVGTYTVWAYAQSGARNCGAAGSVPYNPCGGAGSCQITGTAQLTCP